MTAQRSVTPSAESVNLRNNRNEAGTAPTDNRPLDRDSLTEGGPMPIVPHDALARLDGCSECVINTELPYRAYTVPGAVRCAYICEDCGYAWTTDWKN